MSLQFEDAHAVHDFPTTEGMTFRDHLATAALQGLLAHYGADATPKALAIAAWQYADALNAKRLPTRSKQIATEEEGGRDE